MNSKIKNKIDLLSKKWHLENLRLLSSINNYVVLTYSKIYKTDVVLKILLADTHELEALQFFDGHGCVKLLDYDADTRSMLLEYIQPGTSLKSFFPDDDIKAVGIAVQVMQKMQSTKNQIPLHQFKTINDWLATLHKHVTKKIPLVLLYKAQQLSNQLVKLKQEHVLLHGDLHHQNILLSQNGWIVIDPKGVVGPLEYEVGRFIMNPIPDLLQQHNPIEIIKNRIDTFHMLLGFDKQRMLHWTFVQAVLAACWIEEDGSSSFFEYFVHFATLIDQRMDLLKVYCSKI